jgi:RHH-type proline utilization regulon transcriptional repressor/proline dehydrogenase/delta 1-pyrroline-5-carboxylate dehydrogenase
MLEHPKDKALLIELMDQCFRAESNARVGNQICFLLEKHGMAHFFTTKDKTLLYLFQNIGKYLPSLSVPVFVNQIREDTKTVVIKGEEEIFNAHLQKRKAEGTRVNINLIGEVVLGEVEASERMEKAFREPIRELNKYAKSVK